MSGSFELMIKTLNGDSFIIKDLTMNSTFG